MSDPGAATGNVLVVGAAGGIGRAIVDLLDRDGYHLALADARADALAQSFAGHDSEPLVITADIGDRESVRSLFAALSERFGRLDAVINAAGIAGRGLIDEVEEDLWDRVVAVNLSGVYWACRFAVPLLRAAGGGTIVNIASVAGLREQPGSAVYSASKGGVVMLSRTLAADLVRDGIRVYAVCPPALDTSLVTEAFDATGDPERARREYEQTLRAGRLGSPDQVAELVRMLLRGDVPYSPEALII